MRTCTADSSCRPTTTALTWVCCNVTIFADGEADRSPYGSGTCARLAALAAGGRLPAGTVLRHDSIVGSTFTATVLGTVDDGGRPAVIPQVTGTAYRTGEHLFSIDPPPARRGPGNGVP
jgi:proline racemase/trans-L-3-hydroxyproline dehydratase